MITRPRIVVDTNALISFLLLPNSTAGRAVHKAIESSQLLISDDTLSEVADVISRPKFDRYISVKDRQEFILQLAEIAELVTVFQRIHACRDPRDDKFLELAICGQAELILTGDGDLLALHPFQKIEILSPADYLTR
jgi:putative PIN family toxin of toxin-antitoxin system